MTPFGRIGPGRDAAGDRIHVAGGCGSTGGRGLRRTAPAGCRWPAGRVDRRGLRGGRCAGVRAARPDHGHRRIRRRLAARSHGHHDGRAGRRCRSDHRPASAHAAAPLELPSIVPTADGYVGFCTITGQQFQDFLVLIERFEWLDDADLHTLRRAGCGAGTSSTLRYASGPASAPPRRSSRLASAMRIPVAPIGSPETVTEHRPIRRAWRLRQQPRGFRAAPTAVPDRRRRAAPSAPRHPRSASTPGPSHWTARPDPAGTAVGPPAGGRARHGPDGLLGGPVAAVSCSLLGADVIKVEGAETAGRHALRRRQAADGRQLVGDRLDLPGGQRRTSAA